MNKVVSIAVLVGTMWSVAPAHGQDAVTVSFSNPARPGLLKVVIMNGGMRVTEHAGKDVIFESRGSTNRGGRREQSEGLRRIDSNAAGLSIEEENNVMTVVSRNPSRNSDLEIKVPAKTNLNLRTMNGGDLVVEGVEGEIEVANMNGGVMLINVSGSVVASSANGRVAASLRQVTPDKPMSFISNNGNVDITLPANAKATLKMRTDNGGTYSDFDVQLRPTSIVEERQNGRYRLQTDKTLSGTINGGGPEFNLRTLNGNIYIRQGK